LKNLGSSHGFLEPGQCNERLPPRNAGGLSMHLV
jgi:hypothetical protein